MPDISRDSVNEDTNTYFVQPMNSIENDTSIPNQGPIGAEQAMFYCNNALLENYIVDPINTWTDTTWLNSFLSGSVSRASLSNRIKTLAKWYARATFGMWGLTGTTTSGAWDGYTVPFNQINIFFVQPGWHQTHYDTVVGLINGSSTDEFLNTVTRAGLTTYLTRMKNMVLNNLTDGSAYVDLRICHSSCHSNCHGSRGRR